MEYVLLVSDRTRREHWVRTGDTLFSEFHWDFDGGDVDALIREYVAFGVQASIPDGEFTSRAWRATQDGVRWDYRRVDLNERDIALVEAYDPQVFLRELARDAASWRAACEEAEVRQEAEESN